MWSEHEQAGERQTGMRFRERTGKLIPETR